MERHYYLLKVGVILVAIVTAAVTSGMGSTQVAHAVNHTRYSAPAEIEAAAWHTTAYVARAAACLFGLNANAAL
jgi:hypothetical protein